MSERESELEAALRLAIGFMMNAKIDLETGATKATATRTLEGGIKLARSTLNQDDSHG